MKCPRCQSQQYSRNGFHKGKQKYLCKSCGRQWLGSSQERGYPAAVRSLCLKMYRNGLGTRSIERYTGISHNTVLNWIRQAQSVGCELSTGSDIKGETAEDDRGQQLHRLANFIT